MVESGFSAKYRYVPNSREKPEMGLYLLSLRITEVSCEYSRMTFEYENVLYE